MAAPARRILVTARKLDLDGTSEGSCSVKYVNLLVARGHEVVVLNGDEELGRSPAAWLPGAEVVDLPVPAVTPSRGGAAGSKLAAARAHATGFGALDRARRARWRVALTEAIERYRPHVVITRGAGLDYTPHLALLDLRGATPWVAHYHDPWPLSAYPEPYRRWDGPISRRQESAGRAILRRAGAVTFPSARLLRWQAGHSRVVLGDRGFVVPHLGVAGGLVPGVAEPAERDHRPSGAGDPVRLVHAGSLTRQRDPAPLLAALARVLDRMPDGPSPIRLRLVGYLDPKLTASPAWNALVEPLVARGALEIDDHQVGYVASMAELDAADVLVVFAVGHPESPAFPAKLADVFSLDRPMLVVAPEASAPGDLVGTDSPSFADVDRPDALDRALVAVVERHRAGRLAELRPTPEQRDSVGPAEVGAAIERAVARAVAPSGDHTVARHRRPGGPE